MLAPGDILQSRYVIEALIGEGGMGRVYLSRQVMLRGLRVAIKEVCLDGVHPSDRQAARQAIRHEAETLASLSHPGLVGVKDCFEEDDTVYLVMEYVEGRTLQEVLARDGRLPVKAALDYARQLCTVLMYLHNCSPAVIFRDLKPSNIMLDVSGLVRLVDFGLAQTVGETHDGLLQGTPGYAPIEQLLSIGVACDERSDIYALGATLYHLLSGQEPLDACSRMAEECLMPLIEANAQVPQWLSEGVDRMLSLRQDDRRADILEVRDIIDRNDRNQVTYMAPVLPMFAEAAARSLPRIQAYLKDGLGRSYPVQIFDFDQHRLQFYCEDRRWIRRPREIYFNVRGQRSAIKVHVESFDMTPGAGQNIYQVELKNPPMAVLRVLRDAIRPTAWLGAQRERNAVRHEASVGVALCEIDVRGRTTDVSVSGCRMLSMEPLPLGRRMSVWLMVGDGDRPDVPVVGEVRWCRARWGAGYESGVVFTEIDESMVDVLNLYLEADRLIA